MQFMKLKSVITKVVSINVAILAIASTASGNLPDPGMEIDPDRTALVITDPQNDFLSPNGAAWGVVKESVQANNTVENLDTGSSKPASKPESLSLFRRIIISPPILAQMASNLEAL